jgi:hypothetical protein
METAIVITTINKNTVVERLAKQKEKQFKLYVIGDCKTPKGVPQINIKEQRKWLRDHPKLNSVIPYNTDARRNIGYLMALENGADIVISLDDDNYPTITSEFVSQHESSIGSVNGLEVRVDVGNSWFNYMHLLYNSSGIKIYPRGFPYHARTREYVTLTHKCWRKVAINQGLWIDSPDVDGMTNLISPSKITYVTELGKGFVLSKNTWSPINSQNTAVSKKAMYCYMFMPNFKRFGDIVQGYLARKCIDAMGESVRYGTPIVNHKRTKHDYFKDMIAEHQEIIAVENLTRKLRTLNLTSKTYADCYNELASKIEIKPIAKCMRIWVDEIEKILT